MLKCRRYRTVPFFHRSKNLATPSSLQAAFTSGGKKEHLEVLEKLVQHPRASVGLLLRYAEAFDIQVEMAMVKLASWLLGRLQPALKRKAAAGVHENKKVDIVAK